MAHCSAPCRSLLCVSVAPVVCAVQQLCSYGPLAHHIDELLPILLKGSSDIVANVRFVAAQFLADVCVAGTVPADRMAGSIR